MIGKKYSVKDTRRAFATKQKTAPITIRQPIRVDPRRIRDEKKFERWAAADAQDSHRRARLEGPATFIEFSALVRGCDCRIRT